MEKRLRAKLYKENRCSILQYFYSLFPPTFSTFHEFHLKGVFEIYSLCNSDFSGIKKPLVLSTVESSWWCYKNIRKWFYQWSVSMAFANNLSDSLCQTLFEESTRVEQDDFARSTRIEPCATTSVHDDWNLGTSQRVKKIFYHPRS